MLSRSYPYVFTFAVIFVLCSAESLLATPDRPAIDVESNAGELKTLVDTLHERTIDELSVLLPRCERLMRRIDRIIDGYFRDKMAIVPQRLRLSVRRQILRLQSAKTPVLVFANDALRFHTRIHTALAHAYGKLNEGSAARTHELKAQLSLH